VEQHYLQLPLEQQQQQQQQRLLQRPWRLRNQWHRPLLSVQRAQQCWVGVARSRRVGLARRAFGQAYDEPLDLLYFFPLNLILARFLLLLMVLPLPPPSHHLQLHHHAPVVTGVPRAPLP
jgi:hypothetical protein